MRNRISIVVATAILATVVSPLPAATFQNMDFEVYPAGAPYPTSATMPSWQLVNQLGDGTVLYQNSVPGSPYPFVGYHIGTGPVIGVNGVSPSFPNQLQGKYSITLSPYLPQMSVYPSEAVAQAALNDARYGGLAQTAEVPSWAQSVWVATSGQFVSPLDMNMTFSGHRVALGEATSVEASFVLAMANLSPGLASPLTLPPNNSSVHYFAGNISSVAGLTRELKVLPRTGNVFGSGTNYGINMPPITFDMIVFSPLSWDGPAVNVPEPQSIMIGLIAVTLLRRRRTTPHVR